jgi:glycosyltransferase involved in cell wall biosynthesis
MRILHVITALQVGGAEEVAISLARIAREAGHEVAVAAVFESQEQMSGGLRKRLLDSLRDDGISVIECSRAHGRLALLTAAQRLTRFRSKWQEDIIHLHTDIPEFVGALSLRLRAGKACRTIHNTQLWPTRPWSGYITERVYVDDLVIALGIETAEAHRSLRKRYRLPVTPYFHEVGNGVPFPESNIYAAKHRSGAAEGELKLVFVGRFTTQKGLDILLRAVQHVAGSSATPVSLDVYGAGDEQYDHILDNGPGKSLVRFRGLAVQIAETITDYDLLVVPSRFEGFPLTPLHAFAAGMPALCTLAPGLRSVLPPDWPLTVEPDDPIALADAIVNVANGAFDLVSCGERAREHARLYSIDAMGAAYLQHYDSFLSGACGPAQH